MATTDPIADYLTRIRNALRARHKRVEIPASSLKRDITRILTEQGFISGITEVQETPRGALRIQLRYTDGRPAITGLRRISKPGRRVYVSSEDVPRALDGLGIVIMSTSKGVMTDRQARDQHVGGEVLCYIW
jgi:small subunit ribosomal protein S8